MDPDRDPKLAEAIEAAKRDPRQMTVDEAIEVASKGLDGKPPVANVGQDEHRANQARIKEAVRKQLRTKTFRGK